MSRYLEKENIKIDINRGLRQGFPEVVYGRSKSIEQLLDIAELYRENSINFLCTGLDEQKLEAMRQFLGESLKYKDSTCWIHYTHVELLDFQVHIVSGGLSDLNVCQEAESTLNFLGIRTKLFSDCGVAGLERLLNNFQEIDNCNVIIAVAGMEGALFSVLGGLTGRTIIAVPTSIGYGVANKGETALFSALTSCASGISVVNIDNGFGAAIAAYRVFQSRDK